MNRLELRLPPVLLALASLAAMWAVARWLPAFDIGIRFRKPVSVVLVALGVAVGLAGVAELRRDRTTVDPTRPDRASALVVTGIYRVTRNPMYVALALGLVGAAAWISNLAAMPVPALFIAWITRLQIVPEERALRAKFGAEYEEYASRVRRWL